MAKSENKRRLWPNIASFVAVLFMGLVMLPIFLSESPWPTFARDYLSEYGSSESGASNLVSAIYLGYRLFDTMGETIVLLVAVLGTMSILSRIESLVEAPHDDENSIGTISAFSLATEKRRSHAMRTHLLEVVTGKIGPIVLLFGFYVMLYGHMSPGGGFQGGVIVASGIVFLALGNQQDDSSPLSSSIMLSRMETITFLLLVLASFSGLLVGSGFFGNPLDATLYPVGYMIFLNAIIGLKVGTSIGFMCIAMMGGGS
jgi:multicomponent Na+:H+ antiporter subunit B